jgi:hypothetical protein
MIVVGTMLVHNFICEHKSDDLDFDHVECVEDYELTIPKWYKYVVTSDGLTSLPNVRTTDAFRNELVKAISQYWN